MMPERRALRATGRAVHRTGGSPATDAGLTRACLWAYEASSRRVGSRSLPGAALPVD